MNRHTIVAGLAVAAAVSVVALSPGSSPDAQCWEDEVIIFTDDAHDECIPIDDLGREATARIGEILAELNTEETAR